MTKHHTLLAAIVAATGAVITASTAAQAQRGGDPNMGHFYMARQQITITDDQPLVNNKTTQPGAAQGAGGMAPGAQQGLPAARWTQYSSTDNPSLSTSLPRTSNGVPPKMPAGPTGAKGKAGRLAVPARQVAVRKPGPSPSQTATYAPYKKFSPDGAISGASDAQSNSNVKGDVLHWAHRMH